MMPQFNDENIKKIANKMKDKENKDFVQNIKKLAQDKDGRKVISAIIESVKESELEKEALRPAIKNLGKAVGNNKSSGIMSKAYDVLSKEETGQLMKNIGLGGLGALGTLGGGAYLGQHAYDYTMGQGSKPGNKRLQEVLDTIPELKEKYTESEIQRAWDTLREHGPRLANSDAVTAGKILERLLDYEGVDIQAIEQIIDVEKKKREARQDKMAPIRSKSGSVNEKYINSLSDKIEEVDEDNKIDKEAANEEFNELKELVSEYDN